MIPAPRRVRLEVDSEAMLHVTVILLVLGYNGMMLAFNASFSNGLR